MWMNGKVIIGVSVFFFSPFLFHAPAVLQLLDQEVLQEDFMGWRLGEVTELLALGMGG